MGFCNWNRSACTIGNKIKDTQQNNIETEFVNLARANTTEWRFVYCQNRRKLSFTKKNRALLNIPKIMWWLWVTLWFKIEKEFQTGIWIALWKVFVNTSNFRFPFSREWRVVIITAKDLIKSKNYSPAKSSILFEIIFSA